MFCCPECFKDQFIKNVVSDLSSLYGDDMVMDCSYCSSKNVTCIPPILLQTYFLQLVDSYREDNAGKLLVELFRDDWKVFNDELISLASSKSLLGDILDDGHIVRKLFSPIEATNTEPLLKWSDLRRELMHSNRFFPKSEIDKGRIEHLLSFLIVNDLPAFGHWFRARIQDSDDPLAPDQMLAPPPHLASHGRANPAGIPYLYVASDQVTAVSEIRPHTGDQISIAELTINNQLKIADLRNPKHSISPFSMRDEQEILLLRSDVRFLEKLGEELTRPVLRRAVAYDYVPSQYLCELIKTFGYDGVMYRSSLSSGVNMAIFNPELADVVKVEQHRVSSINVNIENFEN